LWPPKFREEFARQEFGKDCAPRFQFFSRSGASFGKQLGHAPVAEILASAHGVCKMNFPVVAVVHIGKRGSDSPSAITVCALPKQWICRHSY